MSPFTGLDIPSKHWYVSSIKGWAASRIEPHRINTILDAAFDTKPASSEADFFAALQDATSNKKTIALFWWQPDAMPIRYDLVQLKESAPLHPHAWSTLQNTHTAAKSLPTCWPPTPLLKVISRAFFLKHLSICHDISKVFLPTDVLTDCLLHGVQLE